MLLYESMSLLGNKSAQILRHDSGRMLAGCRVAECFPFELIYEKRLAPEDDLVMATRDVARVVSS